MRTRLCAVPLILGIAVVAAWLLAGCGGSSNASLDTVLGQPTGGVKGSTKDLILYISVETGNAEVYAIGPTGASKMRLTASDTQEQGPSWSPDGRQILFASSTNVTAHLYRANIDNTTVLDQNGNEVTFYQITQGGSTDLSPAWSVENQIAFCSDRDEPEYEIYTCATDGTNLQRLTTNRASDNSPKWSPDGEKILFSSNRDNATPEVFLMDKTGGGVQRLTTTIPGWASLAPAMSPDGTKIAYALQQPNGDRDVYVMDAAGGNQRRLTDDGWGNHRPSWSPDGTRLAYEHFGTTPVPDVWVMNADGTNKVQVTTDRDYEAEPSWSPTH